MKPYRATMDDTATDEPKPARVGVYLTRDEIAALRALATDLVAATDDHVFWLGRVRDTALELQQTIDVWMEGFAS